MSKAKPPGAAAAAPPDSVVANDSDFLVPASYELAVAELEKLVARLESGDLPLGDLLSGYQRGAGLLAFCRVRLEAVEGQIKVLDAGVLKTWAAE